MNLKMVLLSYFDVKICFDTLKQIETETEEKLGKYTQGMPGLL